MALISRLFSGDRVLQACALRHDAHILEGAHGQHVAKIQFALFAADRQAIDRRELIAQRYGPSTAAAVLRFKTKRKIINASYQTTPDAIVGIMTIAALDTAMLEIERPTPLIGDCLRSPVGIDLRAAGPGGRASLVGGPTVGKAPTQLSKTLRIYISATTQSDGFPIKDQVQVARDCLFEHGLRLSLEFNLQIGNPVADIIKLEQTMVIDDDVALLRKMSEDIRPGLENVLRVFICRMAGNFGETKRAVRVGDRVVKPFVLLNSNESDTSAATLIHEMIHASLPGPVDHDKLPSSVFFGHGATLPGAVKRTALLPERALALSNGFFAV